MHAAVEQFVAVFTSMGGLMAERVTDLRDIERRVVAHLVGEPEPGVQMPDTPSVLVAEDLAPVRHRALDPRSCSRLVTERGGPTSHTAIIARQLGIPCVVGTAGAMAIAGRHAGCWSTAPPARSRSTPTPDEAARAGRRRPRGRAPRSPPWTGPGATADGTPVKLLANVADGESAARPRPRPGRGRRAVPHRAVLPQPHRRAVRRGAGRRSTPRCSTPFGDGRYVVVRTLDAGSDKPVAFATHEGEENPALGVRGLRLSFDNPGLLTASSTASPRPPSAPAPRPG